MNTGTARVRRPPLWLRGGPRPITDDFKADLRRMCVREEAPWFDDTLEALERCQSLCAICPLFQDCTRWTLAQDVNDLEYGIFAGLTPNVRRKIARGVIQYYDWRQDWHRRNFALKRARRTLKDANKRLRGKSHYPPCPVCASANAVRRNGLNGSRTRQRYNCTGCGGTFYGEAQA